MTTLIQEVICLIQKHCDVFDRDQDEYVQVLREKRRESEVAIQHIEERRPRRSMEENWRREKRDE